MSRKRKRLHGFVAMPAKYGPTSRVRALLTQAASELPGCPLELVFVQERLPTHLSLRRNLYQLVAHADVVLCCTDGHDLDVAFEAGLALGLQKPFALVILPGTRRLPATFMGHSYVELFGDGNDHECLRSALGSLVSGILSPGRAGRLVGLSRLGCAGAGGMLDRAGS